MTAEADPDDDALVQAAREDALRDGRTMLGVLHYELFGRGE